MNWEFQILPPHDLGGNKGENSIRSYPSRFVGSILNNDCNGYRNHNHLVRVRTLNHLAKLAEWLSCVVSTYLYDAFDCMFLSFSRFD